MLRASRTPRTCRAPSAPCSASHRRSCSNPAESASLFSTMAGKKRVPHSNKRTRVVLPPITPAPEGIRGNPRRGDAECDGAVDGKLVEQGAHHSQGCCREE